MRTLFILTIVPCMLCAQDGAADPTLDTAGLPAWINFVPKPAAEPWRLPTGEERLVQYARETFSPVPMGAAGMGALISFGMGRPEEWPRNTEGYARRFGNNAAQHFVRSTAIHGMAAAFGEDNTYYRAQAGAGTGARLGHALSHTFLARNREGRKRWSASRFIGGVGTAKLSRVWVPPSWKGWENVVVSYAMWSATEAGVNVAREFFPDLVRALKQRKARQRP